LGTNLLAGTSLSALTSLQYSTYCTENEPNGQQFPYLALNINLEGVGNGPIDDTLFFEPPYQTAASGNPSLPDQGATVLSQWQSWNALEGGWWDNLGIVNPGTGVNSLAYYLANLPGGSDPVITSGASSDYPSYLPGGISFNVGFASPGDSFNGYVDAFTVGTGAGTTTFDFEAVPEPSALCLLGIGTVSLLAYAWRRQRVS
jgi:hypothetical protein